MGMHSRGRGTAPSGRIPAFTLRESVPATLSQSTGPEYKHGGANVVT